MTVYRLQPTSSARQTRSARRVADGCSQRTTRELAIATWAIGGVALLFLEAVARMGVRTMRLLASAELEASTWLALVVVVGLFCYGEGYLALQRRFVPHVVRRAFAYGAVAKGCLAVIAAPLHAMSLLGAHRRELVRAWAGVALIVVATFTIRALPPLWRGVIDAGVTAALAWGLVALVSHLLWALSPSQVTSSARV